MYKQQPYGRKFFSRAGFMAPVSWPVSWSRAKSMVFEPGFMAGFIHTRIYYLSLVARSRTKILVPRSWYQDLGTGVRVPRFLVSKQGEFERRHLS